MENEKVPEVKFEGNNLESDKVVLPTKVIPLIINGKNVEITLQKISAGQRREATKLHLNTSIVGQQIQGKVDALGFQISILAKVIIKAPFVVSEDMLSNFPDEVLDYLYKQYQEWTQGDSKKKD